MVVRRTQHEALVFLHSEVALLAEKMHGLDTGEVFSKMTCSEAQALADVLAAGGHPEVGEFVVSQHAMGDVDSDDTHHDIYLKEWNPDD
jgi:hypothetical protein